MLNWHYQRTDNAFYKYIYTVHFGINWRFPACGSRTVGAHGVTGRLNESIQVAHKLDTESAFSAAAIFSTS
jgi:hypothetical protein